MSDLAALAYADVRGFVHGARSIWRTPSRLLPWAFFSLVIPAFLLLRFFAPYGRTGGSIARLDAIVLAPLITLAALLLANARVGLFACRAEAHFVSLSPRSRPTTIAYLQLRTIAVEAFRLTFSSIYLLVVVLPRGIGGVQFALDLVLAPLLLVAFTSLQLPRRLAAPPLAAAFIGGAGVTVVLSSAILARDVVTSLPRPLLAAIPFGERIHALLAELPNWHPGHLLVDLQASTIALAVLAAGTVAAVALLARTARNAFPQLYELSQARIDLRERLRTRAPFSTLSENLPAAQRGPRTAHGQPVGLVPAGLAVFCWKAWVEFRRSASPRVRVLVIAGLLALGVAVAIAGRAAPAMLPSLISVGVVMLIAIGVGSAQRLAGELRRPLFHLAKPTLFERLAMLTLAQAGPAWIRGALVVGGALLGGIDPRIAGAALLVTACLFTLLVAAGFALFSLWPDAIDRRGPLALVRVLALFILVGIAGSVGTTVAIVSSIPAGIAAGCACAVITTLALLALATWRLSSGIDLLTLDTARA
ncbi:MAG: putative ABC exporter domain-containing protein [Candidatus Velthaea sp.]